MTSSHAPILATCPVCRATVTARYPSRRGLPRAKTLPNNPAPILRVHGPRTDPCPGSGQALTSAPGPDKALAAPELHADWCLAPDRRLDCRCALAVGEAS